MNTVVETKVVKKDNTYTVYERFEDDRGQPTTMKLSVFRDASAVLNYLNWSQSERIKKMFEVFHRTWWANNWERTENGELKWTDGLEPCVGEETVIARHVATEDDARAICKQWNDTHEAGRLSRKAEFWEELDEEVT